MPWTIPLSRRLASSSTAPGSGRRSGRISRKISPWRRWSVSVSASVRLRPISRADRAGEQTAAHPDASMDPPAIDRMAAFEQRPLPGEDMGVDRVDEGPVEIEDEGAHPLASMGQVS